MGKIASALSFGKRGARHQFAVGVGLISVIPLLGLWYLVTMSLGGREIVVGLPGLLVVLTMLVAAIFGMLVLRQYPRSIIKLRRYTEEIIAGHLPEKVEMPRGEDDIETIERSMNAIVDSLRSKIASTEREKRMLERQLLEADKMKNLGLLASGIAHDFGNIMCVVTGSSELAQKTLNNPARTGEFLKAISTAALQAGDLTQQMLALASGQHVARTRVNISQAISQIAELLRSSAGSSNDVQFRLADTAWVEQADTTQIRQVVLNLVFNAADAMTAPGTIIISTFPQTIRAADVTSMHPRENVASGDYICIEVSDSGCGMDDETRAHLFDTFYTTKMGGRGLGLSVVLGVARNHGGLVGVTASAPGKGTTFRVLLPCQPPRQ